MGKIRKLSKFAEFVQRMVNVTTGTGTPSASNLCRNFNSDVKSNTTYTLASQINDYDG